MRDFDRNDRGRGGRRFGDRSGRRGFGAGDRMMHKAICASCGRECEVPFRPSADRPVYCSDCFEKKRNDGEYQDNRNGRDFGERPRFEERRQRPFEPGNRGNRGQDFSQMTDQLKSLNVKLDKIISLLLPKAETALLVKDEVTAIVHEPKKVKAKASKKKAKEEIPKKEENI